MTARYCFDCRSDIARKRRSRGRRQQALEQAAYLRRIFPTRHDGRYRPCTLAMAELALARGVPLEALILEPYEKAALEAAWTGFPIEQRLAAAERLIELRYRAFIVKGKLWSNEDDRKSELADLAFVIMDALEAARGPVIATYPTRGRRRKVKPWTPAEESWEWLLGIAYLRHVLSERKARLENEPLEDADSLDREIGTAKLPGGYIKITVGDEVAGPCAVYFAGTENEHRSEEEPKPHTGRYGLRFARLSIGRSASHRHQPGETAWLRSLGIAPRSEHDDQEVTWMSATMPAEELRERLTRMECKLNELLDGLPDLCERLRERWPESEELSAEIDRLLEDIG